MCNAPMKQWVRYELLYISNNEKRSLMTSLTATYPIETHIIALKDTLKKPLKTLFQQHKGDRYRINI